MTTTSKSLISQIGSYGAWLIVSKGVGFLLLPFYTHYLTPRDYGVLAVLDLIATNFEIAASSGFSSALMRFHSRHNAKKWHRIVFASCLTAVAAIGLFLVVIGTFLVSPVATLFGATNITTELVFIILATTLFNAINNIGSTLLRIQERVAVFIKVGAVLLLVAVTLNVILIAGFGMGVYGFAYSGLVTSVIGVGMYLTITSSDLSHMPNFRLVKKMAGYSYPYILSGFISSLTHSVAIYLVMIFGDLSSVGIYAVGQKISTVVSVVGSSIVTAWTPYMFKISKHEEAATTYATGALMIFTFMLHLSLVVSILSEPLVSVMTTSDYRSASDVVLPVTIALSFFILMPTVRIGINIANKTSIIPIIGLAALVVGFPIGLILTAHFGMVGASWCLTLIWCLNVIFTMVASAKHLRVPYESRKVVVVLLCFAVSISIHLLSGDSYLIGATSIAAFPLLLLISGAVGEARLFKFFHRK